MQFRLESHKNEIADKAENLLETAADTGKEFFFFENTFKG